MKLLLGLLAIAAQIFVIGCVCFTFIVQVKNLLRAIKEKNRKWTISTAAILLFSVVVIYFADLDQMIVNVYQSLIHLWNYFGRF